MTRAEHLHIAIAAVCPILGISGDLNGPAAAVSIFFADAATQQQRTNGQAVLDGWDFSEAAEAARTLAALRTTAQAKVDTDGNNETLVVARAMLLELFDYVNTTRQRYNDLAAKHDSLLTWLGTQATLINRNQLPAMASTPAAIATITQARTAIKNRIAAGEAD